MSKLKNKISGKPSEKPQAKDAIDNIFEMAEVVPAMVREVTKGGTDGAIEITHKLLREMLEESSKAHLLKRQVIEITRRFSKQEREIFRRLDEVEWDKCRHQTGLRRGLQHRRYRFLPRQRLSAGGAHRTGRDQVRGG